jgi:hypothetical protein
MENNFSIDVLAEDGLGLAAKLLLFFERKQINVKLMTLEDLPEDEGCAFNFLVQTSDLEVERTSLFISKQVGVMDVGFYPV